MALLVVGLLHAAAIVGLVAAFTPELGRQAVQQGLAAFDLGPPPPPPASPPPAPAPSTAVRVAARAAGAAGLRAQADAVAAPTPRIALATDIAAPIAGTGADLAAGAGAAGAGTGAGGSGNGPGGGGAGPVKLAGEIGAGDYPAASRASRIGDFVVVAIAVGTDGRPSGCRVHRASRDAAADAITCRLALERFRFRPATDGAGGPVASTYGWKQSWHY